MREKSKSVVFFSSYLLLLLGAVLYMWYPEVASYLFAVGAAGYTLVQLTIRNTDMNFRQKRLHRFNIFSGMLCIAASALMFNDRKEWLVCLTIAVILQLYTAFVMPKAE